MEKLFLHSTDNFNGTNHFQTMLSKALNIQTLKSICS
uniref:Uncharacterized protein n=1 Tax=Anguilla anguilla TaxID=7936 RepID=A0A0E9U0D6_ANGAN